MSAMAYNISLQQAVVDTGTLVLKSTFPGLLLAMEGGSMKSTRILLSLMVLLVVARHLPARAAEVPSAPMTSNQASFAADLVDVEWSAQKKKEIEETLSGVSNSSVVCKSSMCRVTLTWTSAAGGESREQLTQRVAKWTESVSRKGGFVRADTDFRPNDPTTVSYLSTKLLMGRLPPGLSAEAADAFRQCLRDDAERLRQQGPADPATPSVGTCTF